MNVLPDGSTASYNGFTFPLYTETESIDGTPVYDQAGRTVSHVVYSISIRSLITTDGTEQQPYQTDAQMQTIRQQLEAPGGALVYTNKGFGNLVVNVASGQGQGIARDVAWGPKTRLLSWKPKGGPAACEIRWRVEVAVAPECPNNASMFALMEWNYSLKMSMDRSGYTRRVYSGHIRIPQTRLTQSSRKITYSADDYRESIYPKVPTGFRREDRDFDLSADKCTLTFSITDTEVPVNVPPRGIVDCSASHSVSSSGQVALARWIGTISGTYEVAKDQPRALPWQFFWALCQDRLQWANKNAKIGKEKGVAYPVGLIMSEPEIYGRQCASFTFTYLIRTDLENALKASGLWRQVPNSDYPSWANSMQSLVWNVRGTAKLKFDPGQDVIVDLCHPVKAGKPILQAANAARGPQKGAPAVAGLPALTEDSSWVVFENRVRVEERHARVVLKPLPKNKNDVPKAIIQERAAPSYEAVMEGYAIRVGQPVTAPKLTSVGGVQAFPLNQPGQGFRTWVGANLVEPAWFAQWSLRYVLGERPKGQIQGPPNPLLGQKQGQDDKAPAQGWLAAIAAALGQAAQGAVGPIQMPDGLR